MKVDRFGCEMTNNAPKGPMASIPSSVNIDELSPEDVIHLYPDAYGYDHVGRIHVFYGDAVLYHGNGGWGQVTLGH